MYHIPQHKLIWSAEPLYCVIAYTDLFGTYMTIGSLRNDPRHLAGEE